ncbi:Hypothetical Protein FCC1311_031062 [Hondaea fermentalgiana]|uniref:Uncharacterized protein n=1 Tax=Hondaea fermentalgiana TaxID=2315210 RepID=A0A2R5GGB2_9STRA|nr:Hypothetical Protein FCC1311_031062 [Hondaea fermentalgiana]|eukprot:GBG26884.1 Hypothetical Protein FCC1311_031062 [Hondaea fermentalgiana]
MPRDAHAILCDLPPTFLRVARASCANPFLFAYLPAWSCKLECDEAPRQRDPANIPDDLLVAALAGTAVLSGGSLSIPSVLSEIPAWARRAFIARGQNSLLDLVQSWPEVFLVHSHGVLEYLDGLWDDPNIPVGTLSDPAVVAGVVYALARNEGSILGATVLEQVPDQVKREIPYRFSTKPVAALVRSQPHIFHMREDVVELLPDFELFTVRPLSEVHGSSQASVTPTPGMTLAPGTRSTGILCDYNAPAYWYILGDTASEDGASQTSALSEPVFYFVSGFSRHFTESRSGEIGMRVRFTVASPAPRMPSAVVTDVKLIRDAAGIPIFGQVPDFPPGVLASLRNRGSGRLPLLPSAPTSDGRGSNSGISSVGPGSAGLGSTSTHGDATLPPPPPNPHATEDFQLFRKEGAIVLIDDDYLHQFQHHGAARISIPGLVDVMRAAPAPGAVPVPAGPSSAAPPTNRIRPATLVRVFKRFPSQASSRFAAAAATDPASPVLADTNADTKGDTIGDIIGDTAVAGTGSVIGNSIEDTIENTNDDINGDKIGDNNDDTNDVTVKSRARDAASLPAGAAPRGRAEGAPALLGGGGGGDAGRVRDALGGGANADCSGLEAGDAAANDDDRDDARVDDDADANDNGGDDDGLARADDGPAGTIPGAHGGGAPVPAPRMPPGRLLQPSSSSAAAAAAASRATRSAAATATRMARIVAGDLGAMTAQRLMGGRTVTRSYAIVSGSEEFLDAAGAALEMGITVDLWAWSDDIAPAFQEFAKLYHKFRIHLLDEILDRVPHGPSVVDPNAPPRERTLYFGAPQRLSPDQAHIKTMVKFITTEIHSDLSLYVTFHGRKRWLCVICEHASFDHCLSLSEVKYKALQAFTDLDGLSVLSCDEFENEVCGALLDWTIVSSTDHILPSFVKNLDAPLPPKGMPLRRK